MRFSRDLVVVVVLFAALMGLTVLGALFEQSGPPTWIPYSTHTTEPQGAQALQRWLEALGYDTFRIEGSTFSIPQSAQLLFILNESDYLASGDADAVME
ncbi:MAG: DUF4350 domain-containing protein, partial [Chloroflexi bacterium]|nr:DUF4350 domain-containing protein [Chloroflexota bacterium]